MQGQSKHKSSLFDPHSQIERNKPREIQPHDWRKDFFLPPQTW